MNVDELKRIELAEYSRLMYYTNRDVKLRKNARWRALNPGWAARWKRENRVKCKSYVAKFRLGHPERYLAMRRKYNCSDGGRKAKKRYANLYERRERDSLNIRYLRALSKCFFKRAGLPVPSEIPEPFLLEWLKPKIQLERHLRKQQTRKNLVNEKSAKHKSATGPDHVRAGNHEMLKAA